MFIWSLMKSTLDQIYQLQVTVNCEKVTQDSMKSFHTCLAMVSIANLIMLNGQSCNLLEKAAYSVKSLMRKL